MINRRLEKPFLALEVRRSNLVQDSLSQVIHEIWKMRLEADEVRW
jgi:hypothetical protein